MLGVLEITGAMLVVVIGYGIASKWWPAARCPGERWRWLPALFFDVQVRCDGGWYGAKHQRKCTRCKGTGRVLRRGRRVLNAVLSVRRGAE